MIKLLTVALLPCGEASQGDEKAAAEAASYWRGGRVRAAEEPNLPAPIIDLENGTIDYQGLDTVQECLEYYVDSGLEGDVKQKLLKKELEGIRARERNEELPEPRGLVAYLLMENADRTMHRDMVLSIRCLGRYFWRYPVAIFHTNGTTAAELAWIRQTAPKGLRLIFEEVHLDFPPSLKDAPGGPDSFLAPPLCVMDGVHWWTSHRSCGCRCPAWRPQCWPQNWMHATRFFTAGMFRTKTFEEGRFDFFMRLDTDLFFVEAPVVDPFRLMAERGCVIVYDRLSREAPGCFDDFDQRTSEYMTAVGYNYDPDQDILHIGRGPAAAGGQWTVGDARLFSSKPYLSFADFLASGIYTNRWADQLFLVRGASLFGPKATMWKQTEESPATSICLSPLFPDGSAGGEGGAGPGLVHLKGGFREQRLIQTCSAEDVFK